MSTIQEPLIRNELTYEAITAEAGDRLDYHQLDEHVTRGLRALLSSWIKDKGHDPQAGEEIRFRRETIFRTRTCMRVRQAFEDTPALGAHPVVKPLFIVGLPRTGTTLLHRLLALDPNARALQAWETQFCPVPPPHFQGYDQDPRIQRIQRGIDQFNEMNPEFKKIHQMGAREPEECNRLFLMQFYSRVEAMNHGLPSFRTWLSKQDMGPACAFYKQLLQLWSWHFPPQHWVLKAPLHLYHLESLLEVFPDACVIHTHRHPLKVAPSYMSLRSAIRKAYKQSVPSGEELLRELTDLADASLEHHGRISERNIQNLTFEQLMADPIGVIRKIYADFNYAYTPVFEENMLAWLKQNRRHKHGAHRYDLVQYQLTEDRVLEAFSDYIHVWKDFMGSTVS